MGTGLEWSHRLPIAFFKFQGDDRRDFVRDFRNNHLVESHI
jgi:hypothetical protein